MAVAAGANVTKVAVDAIQAKVVQALTKTARTYTWTQFPIAVGISIESVDFTDMRNAANIAYDYRTNGAGNAAHNTTVNASNHGYNSANKSNDSDWSYCSDNSYDNDRRSY